MIDAKRYKGEIGTVQSGGLVRPAQTHLVINGRDQSALLEGVLSQARCVEGVLARGRLEDVPVWPILCFLGGEFQLLTRAARGVALCGPKRAAKVIQSDGPLDEEARLRITRLLAERLRPAVG